MQLIRRFARHGVIGTLKLLPVNLRHFCRGLTPAAIAARRLDRQFDRLHGTKTSGIIPLGALDIPAENEAGARWYGPTSPEIFDMMMRMLPIDPSGFGFIDYGSGLGRALLLASRYPFNKLIGIELSERLHREASENLAKFRPSDRVCYDAISLRMDAREFQPPPGDTIFFFNSPFGREVMSLVLQRIEDAHRALSSRLYVLYEHPHEHELFAASPFWVVLGRSGDEWAIYARRSMD